jgi:hypothetical protein
MTGPVAGELIGRWRVVEAVLWDRDHLDTCGSRKISARRKTTINAGPLSSSKYFKWAAHDDVMAPRFLEECVRALEQHPAIVLAFGCTQLIGEDGEPILAWPDHDGRQLLY